MIDTDTANEIDDQFALAWALLAPEALRVQAVYAAPFSFAHRRASLPDAPADAPPFCAPAVGMERSLGEIERVFALLDQASAGRVFAGARGYLRSARTPQPSAAAEHLVALARAWQQPQPLYVLALGCVTNLASALLMAPEIAARIVVVWTSGFPSHAPHRNDSFNLEQDAAATRVLLASGVPLVYLPGYQVGAQLRLSLAEMERYVRGRGAIGDALYQLFTHNPLWSILPQDPRQPYSWVIWDVICVAWLLDPDWVPGTLVRTPQLARDLRWRAAPKAHLMREGYGVQRDAIFNDFFARLPR